MESFWIFITIVLDVFPFIFLQYLPFKDKLKYGYVKTICICMFMLMFWFIPFPFLMQQPWFTLEVMIIYRVSMIIPLFIFTVIFIRNNLYQNLFVFFLMLPYVLCNLIITSYFKQFIGISHSAPYMLSCLGRMLSMIINFPIALWGFRRLLIPALRLQDGGIWKYAWSIPATYNLISIFLIRDSYELNNASFLQIMEILSIMVSCVLTCFMMIRVLKRMQERAELLERERHSFLLLELQAQQYTSIAAAIEETARNRHDMRHHLLLIKSYLKNANLEDLRSYISEYENSLSLHIPMTTFSHNHVINAILGHYITMAENEKIQVEVDLNNVELTNITDTDLCVLLGNLLENAIEACRTYNGQRKIQLKSSYLAGRFAIIISNDFDGIIQKKNGHYLSRKRSFMKEGVGLATIGTIVHKYNGQLRIHQEEHRFQVSLYVK